MIIYDLDRGERDMVGGLKKLQYPKRDFENVLYFREGS